VHDLLFYRSREVYKRDTFYRRKKYETLCSNIIINYYYFLTINDQNDLEMPLFRGA